MPSPTACLAAIVLVVLAVAVIVIACVLRQMRCQERAKFRCIDRALCALQTKQDACCVDPPRSVRFLGTADDVQRVTPGTYTPLIFPSLTVEGGVVYDQVSGGFRVTKTGLYTFSVDVQEVIVSPQSPPAPVTAALFASIGAADDTTAKYGYTSVAVAPDTTTIATAGQLYAQAGDVVYFVTRVDGATSVDTPAVNYAQNNAALAWAAP